MFTILFTPLTPLLQLQDNVPTSKQIYLVGHDWGSYIAHTWADRNAGRVKKLVLLDVLVTKGENPLEGGVENLFRKICCKCKRGRRLGRYILV